MAQMYTLEEAAQKLGLTTEDMTRRLNEDWKTIKKYRDGATWRFQSHVIDELARSLGRGSDHDLPLDEPTAKHSADDEPLGMDVPLHLDEPPTARTPAPARAAPHAAAAPAGDLFKLADDAPVPKPSKPDSGVRLEKEAPKRAAKLAPEHAKTEEVDLGHPPVLGPTSGGSSIKKGPKTGPLKPVAGPITPSKGIPKDDSSEFELSLKPDSDEFELELTDDDGGDEVMLGRMPARDLTSKSGDSGINLQSPADSGISLERAKDDESGIDFELNLEGANPAEQSGIHKPPKKNLIDSDSEFELTLDDSGGLAAPANEGQTVDYDLADEPQKDIFETDFEIPALEDESASEAVAIEEADTDLESSDFDLALDESDVPAEAESGSQVMVLDDELEVEPAAAPKPRKRKPRPVDLDEGVEGAVSFDDMELEAGPSASQAMRGVAARRVEEDEDEEAPREVVVAAGPAPWGPLPALLLFPCVAVLFVVGLMGYELLHGMWGYQQPNKTASVVVKGIAGLFTDDLPKD